MTESLNEQDLLRQLRQASEQIKKGNAEALQAAAVGLSQVVTAQNADTEVRGMALLFRARCQQRMAHFAGHLDEVLAFHESALRDLEAAVNVNRAWFAQRIGQRWLPEHPAYVPAYTEFIRLRSEQPDHVLWNAMRAIGRMGLEGDEARPILEELQRRGSSSTLAQSLHSLLTEAKDSINDVIARLEEELQIYPSRDDRFEGENEVSEFDALGDEQSFVANLANTNWAVRAKSACILRLMVEKPAQETIRTLLDHLGVSENRGIVRGQCALTLAHFASKWQIKSPLLEQLVGRLRERLEGDTAWPVKAISANCLAQITPNRPEVMSALIDELSVTNNVNVARALVLALSECGPSAAAALPLVLRFKPHRLDYSGDVVRAVAILALAPADHPAARKALNDVCRALDQRVGYIPDNAGVAGVQRELRETALKSIRRLPMDDLLRKKLVLQRLSFDDCARLRCEAANVLIEIDKDLAKKAGAYRFVSRIARQRP